MKLDNRSATINFDMPERVDAEDLVAFICDALETWGGQRHPDDPLSKSLRINTVTVGNVKHPNPFKRRARW